MDEVTALTLGMTVLYRGREYILAGFQEGEDDEGRSLTVQGLEPIYFQRNRMDKRARRRHTEDALALLPKMEKALDEAAEL